MRPPILLANVLPLWGYQDSPKSFREILRAIKLVLFHQQSEDEILCYAQDREHFCKLVRERVGLPDLPEAIILTTLITNRKQPRVAVPAPPKFRRTSQGIEG